MQKFKVIVDYGKPFEVEFSTLKGVKQYLKRQYAFYMREGANLSYYDIQVYLNGEDITESNLIESIFMTILKEEGV